MGRVCALGVTILLLTLAPAAAAGVDRSLIVVGKSIGPIALDMTRNEVVQRFGKPFASIRFEFVSGEVGRVVRYRKHGGAFRITYADGRVVGISTAARFYRTAEGVGPGVPLSLGASLPGFRFDQCTGGFVRQAFRALTYFVSRSGRLDGQITRVEIYRIGYIDC
jgi:hypothetical protein